MVTVGETYFLEFNKYINIDEPISLQIRVLLKR